MSEQGPRGAVPAATRVIVSGASRGLGLCLAQDLLEAGLRVAAFSRTVTDDLARLSHQHPERCLVAEVDITDDRQVADFVTATEERLGVVDGLVNNAAIGQDSLHLHTAAEQLARIVDTNLTAPLKLTRLVLRRLIARGGTGRLVNVTSVCAQRGFPGLVAYSATKGGMEAASRSLAREMAGRVLVNAVSPGFFASEMSSVLGDQQLDQILRRTPSGRLTEPADVVPVVRMLLLGTTNINGQSIVVDGAAAS